MCGIAGFVRKDGGPADPERIAAMTAAVAHRGPDGFDHHVEGAVALGHRRLSILDLSERGRQPMSSPDGSLTITYNGEIYNYIEIRDELTALGHRFTTGTDTEVLLAAYRQWGEDCLARLNGMWAFAILDRPRNRLFMARDRFGVKPFHYVETAGFFAFGSEIRQLLPLLDRRRADLDVVRTFLLTGGADLDESSFFADVRRLPGGHAGVYDLARGTLDIRRYYAIPRRDAPGGRFGETVEQFSALIESAVRVRLRSDVKVGTCLSGGLDSSSVASIAASLNRETGGSAFSAITAVSEDERFSEARYAELVVKASGLDWHRTRPVYSDFVETLPRIVSVQEEPFGSPSLTMQYFVMQTARENGVTVLLDGQGGDEVLLGYEKYYGAYVLAMRREHGTPAALRALFDIRSNNDNMNTANLVKYLAGGLSGRAREFTQRRRHSYLAGPIPSPAHWHAFSRSLRDCFSLQALEIGSTNLPVLLRYEDKNSMAHGVESRLPFLDYRLVEFCLSLPVRDKIQQGWTKWLLRKAVEKYLPDPIVWRKNKMGFEAPEALWLNRHMPEMTAAVLGSPLIRELTSQARLAAGYARLDRRSQWRLYSTALWAEAFGVS